MRVLKICVALVALTAVLGGPAVAQWRPQIERGAVEVPRGDLFIRNLDAVWTANDTVYHNVSILIRNGIIREIGANITPPRGVAVVVVR